MYNKYQNVFRLGISRSPEITSSDDIRLGDISVEKMDAVTAVRTLPVMAPVR